MPDQGNSYPSASPFTGTPGAEKTGGASGVTPTLFAMGDHQHPRLTSAANITLDANGQAAVTFTRTFDVEPVPFLSPIGVFGASPPEAHVESWIMTGPLFSGANIRGTRPAGQTLAAVTVLSVSVAAGGQTVGPQNTAPAANVRFGCIFLQPSAPA